MFKELLYVVMITNVTWPVLHMCRRKETCQQWWHSDTHSDSRLFKPGSVQTLYWHSAKISTTSKLQNVINMILTGTYLIAILR